MRARVEILGVLVDNVDNQEAIWICRNIIEEKSNYNGNEINSRNKMIITPNSEILLNASRNEALKQIFKDSALVIPDGAGVVLASKILGRPLKERVAGVDLVKALLEIGTRRGYRFYFLGGTHELAKKAETKLQEVYPGIQIETHHGYFNMEEEEKIKQRLKEERFDVLLAGMGSPRQEKWLQENLANLNVSLGVGVGGSFDVLVGDKKRAPLVMQKLYLEWLYRLLQEPRRIWRMKALPIFLMKVGFEKFRELL